MREALHYPLELRHRKSSLIIGIVSAIGFAVMGTASVVTAAWNIDGSFRYPMPTAAAFGIFWGVWLLFALYIIALSQRAQLTLTSQLISAKGVFRVRSIAFSEANSVKWRTWPYGGSVVIFGPNSRIVVCFEHFAIEREELSSRLRELLPDVRHDNWEAFVRLQQSYSAYPPRTRTSGIVCMGMFFAAAVVSFYCWSIGLGLPFLATGATCILASVWYMFRIIKFVPNSDSKPGA